MGRSITVVPKKRGRPPKGKDPLLTVRAPAHLIEAINAWAAKEGFGRSEAVRRLIELGLGLAKEGAVSPRRGA
ncbi:ribbon-helix-helix protein, CopG family [Reyranella sp.]|uniref:ribbon-helix-helix protein, CopG family n=1 Tax=Reyranella sp. TaxID=1929291 RepID=UPI003D137B81